MVSDRGSSLAPLRDQAGRKGVSEIVQAGVRSCAVSHNALYEQVKRLMHRSRDQGPPFPSGDAPAVVKRAGGMAAWD